MITSTFVTGIFVGITIAYVIDRVKTLIKDIYVYRKILENERKEIHRDK